MTAERSAIAVVRAYFQKIGLAGPTVAQAEQVISALDEAGMLKRAVRERDEWRYRAKDTERFKARADQAERDLAVCREALKEAQPWVAVCIHHGEGDDARRAALRIADALARTEEK